MDVVYKKAESQDEIKKWVEKNGGSPAIIDDPAVTQDQTGLRINWKGKRDEEMLSQNREVTKDISWEEFFEEMERKDLDFLYSDNEEVNPTWSYKFTNRFSTED